MQPLIILYFITFLSGASALAYQILWARSFANIFGSTVEATSLTFAGFLLGLGIGAYIFGYIAERIKKLKLAYFIIEIAIAASACGLGIFMENHDVDLARFFNDFAPPMPTALIFILTPTILIGGTLPVLFKLTQLLDYRGEIIGRIYAANTSGAAIGVLLTGVIFISTYGVIESYWIAGAMNIISGLAVFGLPPLMKNQQTIEFNNDEISRKYSEGFSAKTKLSATQYILLLMTAFFSGFFVFGQEIIWTQLSAYLLGNRVFAITTLLFSILILLSIGSMIASKIARRKVGTYIHVLALVAFISVAGCGLSSIFAHLWIENMQAVGDFLPAYASLYAFYHFTFTFLLLVPVILPLGLLFPLTLIQVAEDSHTYAKSSGQFYFINMLGSVLGALITGLVLISSIGTMTTIFIYLIMAFALGVVLFGDTIYLQLKQTRWPYAVAIPVSIGIITVMPLETPILLQDWHPTPKESDIVALEETKYGIFHLYKQHVRASDSYNNSKYVVWAQLNKFRLSYLAGLWSTQFTQEMAAHLGKFYNPDARNAAVIGIGYGITVGAMGQYKNMHVDAVELLPTIVKYANHFSDFNYKYYENDDIDIHITDGRYFLASQAKKYDIISLTPANHHIPTSARLAHKEMFEIVSDSLAPGGVLVFHLYGDKRANVINTLRKTFSHLRFHSCYHSETMCIVASNEPLEWKQKKVRELVKQPAIREMFHNLRYKPIKNTNISLSPENVFKHSYDTQTILEKVKGKPIVSDNHPLTEFHYGDAKQLFYIEE